MKFTEVVLTKEQELATQKWIDSGYSFKAYIKDFGKWSKDFKPLNDIKPEEFALVLSGFYRIEEGFKAGDWVQSDYTGSYFKLTNGNGEGAGKILNVSYVTDNKQRFTKVESKWKLLLLNNGRSECEFKIGDIVIFESCVYEIKTDADIKSACLDAENGYIFKVAFAENVSSFGVGVDND